MGIQFIRNALEHAMENGYVSQRKVNEYVTAFASDRRYKLQWLAADCYKSGCGSGILKYRGREYYFFITNETLILQYN